MTVQEVITLLSKLPDKEMTMLVDCPSCGQANQLATIVEVVVVHSRRNLEKE